MIKSIHLDNLTPFQLCEDAPAWYRGDIYTFEPPYEIEPTIGEHDFNTCEGCQKNIKQIETYLTQIFEGTNEKQGFPFCCPLHSNLVKEKEFNRSDFVTVPNMVARKAIYTRQHIINNHHLDNWYMVITDYILWAIESFGSMPKGCGEPLYLSIYRHFIIDDLQKDDTEIPLEKRRKLLEFFRSLQDDEEASNTDINVLIQTYKDWIKLFPFELDTYFGNIGSQYKNELPIFTGRTRKNMYSGKTMPEVHTKSSLFECLTNTTSELLSNINGAVLHKKGLISDITKIQIDLLVKKREMEDYTNRSPNEDVRYRRMIKKWLNDEKKFFKELKLLLQSKNEAMKKTPRLVDDCRPHETPLPENVQKEPQLDRLKAYFLPTFKGMGNGTINYFDAIVAELKTPINAKEIAEIAFMAYNGGNLNQRKPNTFREWHRLFCDCLVLECKSYDPNKLKNPSEKLKNLFNYLQK